MRSRKKGNLSEPVRWTEAQLSAHMQQFGGGVATIKAGQLVATKPKPTGRTQPQRGVMNKIEADYDRRLTSAGIPHKFESVTLKLAEGVRYTPDFCAQYPGNPRLAMIEVKQRWRNARQRGPNMTDDARVKLLTAARLFPEFDFVLAWYNPDTAAWHTEPIAK